MAETVIRINKRAVERTVWILIIIALAVLLMLKWDAAPADNSEQLESLQAQIDSLNESNVDLQAQLEATQAALEEAKEAAEQVEEPADNETEEETEEGPQLSGIIEATWQVEMDGDSLERVIATFTNGRDTSERISYRLYWDGYDKDSIRILDSFVIRSGDIETLQIYPHETESLVSTPESSIDTLVLEITDNDDELIDALEEVVR